MAFASPEKPRIYKSVGKCIYCERGPADGAVLTKEHIVPLSLKGCLLLRDGSCFDCAKVTSRYEQDCARIFFGAFREYHGVRSNRHKKDSRKIPVDTWKAPGDKVTTWHEPNEFPDILFFLQFVHLPYVLIGLEETGQPRMIPRVSCREGFDLTSFIGKTAGQFDPYKYAQLMAKIAHGYATVRLGLGSFRPLTLDLILSRTLQWWHFVGGPNKLPPPEEGHCLRLDPFFDHRRRKQFVTGTVRLFAGCTSPRYIVAVGELPYDSRLLLDLPPEPEFPS
jgi:hypothetical protein